MSANYCFSAYSLDLVSFSFCVVFNCLADKLLYSLLNALCSFLKPSIYPVNCANCTLNCLTILVDYFNFSSVSVFLVWS